VEPCDFNPAGIKEVIWERSFLYNLNIRNSKKEG